ncbi:WXG100 family type VII secretion target [Streptomyces sp. NPDC086010]|uniref:WXG100 family type VII secretion target n=1 Tax=Streptomyces sp. NPDC086010 TaxID=3365745 RepID=UPI0037D2DE39
MPSEGIYIHHNSAVQFVEHMNLQTQRMENTLTQLENTLAQIVPQWHGADRAAYLQAQTAWDNRVLQLKQAMTGHTTVLLDIAERYQRTNLQAAQNIGGVL